MSWETGVFFSILLQTERRDFAFAHFDRDLARDRTPIVRPRSSITQIDDDGDRRRTVMESITSELDERGVDRGLGDVRGKSYPDQFLITTTSTQVSA
jgi:hypothetical protein